MQEQNRLTERLNNLRHQLYEVETLADLEDEDEEEFYRLKTTAAHLYKEIARLEDRLK